MDITPAIDKLLRGSEEDNLIALEILKSQDFDNFEELQKYVYIIRASVIVSSIRYIWVEEQTPAYLRGEKDTLTTIKFLGWKNEIKI